MYNLKTLYFLLIFTFESICVIVLYIFCKILSFVQYLISYDDVMMHHVNQKILFSQIICYHVMQMNQTNLSLDEIQLIQI